MMCPKCKLDIGPINHLEYRNMKSGEGFNHEFGQTEYWFHGEFKCPECFEWFEYGDSSL